MSAADRLRSLCRACVYGFPEPMGYSCSVTGKPASAVIVRCEVYRKKHGAKAVAK